MSTSYVTPVPTCSYSSVLAPVIDMSNVSYVKPFSVVKSTVISPPVALSAVPVQPVLLATVVSPPDVLFVNVDVVPISVAKVVKLPVCPAPSISFVLHSTSAFVNVDVVKVSVATVVKYPVVCPAPVDVVVSPCTSTNYIVKL